MRVPEAVCTVVKLPTCIMLLTLAACGGGVDGSGSGSVGGPPTLGGTFTDGALSQRLLTAGGTGYPIFGAEDSAGDGFFVDLTSSAPAIFVFQTASDNGAVAGFFNAYAENGYGGETGLGLIVGTVAETSGTIQSDLAFAFENLSNNTVDLLPDSPALATVPFSTSAGTFQAVTGYTKLDVDAVAIASTGFSNSSSATYTVTLSSSGAVQVSSDAGCSFAGTATADSSYAIYILNGTYTCSGSSGSLNGHAVYLPASKPSPITGTALASDALVLELDDYIAGTPTRALAMIATRSTQ